MDERIRDYICSLEPGQEELYERIAEDARARDIPIVRPETGALLKTITAAIPPGARRAVGTAVGSAA